LSTLFISYNIAITVLINIHYAEKIHKMPISTNLRESPSPTALIILDGFGLSEEIQHNAVYQADTRTLDYLKQSHFYATLSASGEEVGLPQNYIGNSEVGHLTIGMGRIISQSLTALNKITQPHNLVKNKTLNFLLHDYYQTNHPKIHVIGMVSDKGIHSHIQHIKNIILTVQKINPEAQIILHYILDGRDSLPQSAYSYILNVEQSINLKNIQIGSVHGRFYAMDRDNNQERTEESGQIFTTQQSIYPGSVQEYVKEQYKLNRTDEFIKPCALIKDHTIKSKDVVIYSNFRLDRITQLAQYIQDHAKPKHAITPIPYKNPIKSTPFYSPKPAQNGLIETLSKNNKTIFSIAETEKDAHVSYFFNGGTPKQFKNETRRFVPSKKEVSFANNPKMSAAEITEILLKSLQTNPQDFYLVNYANADMVGHSGDLPATVKAIEFLDKQIKKLYEEIVIKQQGTLFITADHGNAESMLHTKEDQPHTAHTTNKVPFFAINAQNTPKRIQGLKDVAPCILQHFNLQVPEEMLD
jgi:2,3-bisphosphoglycerate-independent phosphoglycerate mutase